MKSFKEFTKDTVYTYEWTEFQEGPQNTWTMLQHKIKSIKVKDIERYLKKTSGTLSGMIPVSKVVAYKAIKSKAKQLLKSVNKRTEVLLLHPEKIDLLILQKKVVGRDLPDAVEWIIIEK